MAGFPQDLTVTAALPGSPEGRTVLTAYFHDIVSREHGREATRDEVDSAMRAEPSDDLCPPSGLFLVARRGGPVIGCVGLLLVPRSLGEGRPTCRTPACRARRLR